MQRPVQRVGVGEALVGEVDGIHVADGAERDMVAVDAGAHVRALRELLRVLHADLHVLNVVEGVDGEAHRVAHACVLDGAVHRRVVALRFVEDAETRARRADAHTLERGVGWVCTRARRDRTDEHQREANQRDEGADPASAELPNLLFHTDPCRQRAAESQGRDQRSATYVLRVALRWAPWCPVGKLRVRERLRAVDLEREIVDVAVPPVLTGLVGLDDRVIRRVKVRGRMPVGRLVTAADVTARFAQPQVDPLSADA